ncbi:MAG TPA: trigger factor, partial [Flavobacterium sp.]|nr:trigger factor [Flavobacterium sp.]
MNITKENIDALNAIVTVEVTKSDYADKVAKILSNYRKSANIPGFRKGSVPMSIIQKQYGKAVLLDEINKFLQSSLNNYILQEKLDILGNPLPKVTDDFNWDKEDFTFKFELGLAPQFNLDLTSRSNVVRYKIVADDTMLNEQINRIQKQYGKLISKDVVEEGFEVSGTFLNTEHNIQSRSTFALDIFKDKKTAQEFIGKQQGDVVTLRTKNLFDDAHKLMNYLKVPHDVVHDLDVEVSFTIEEINSVELAPLNQELF